MDMQRIKRGSLSAKESGAALVVTLIMLMVLTILAVSTMRTAAMEVTMAGNAQFSENAFQLAETASEQFIRNTAGNTFACVNEQNPTACDIPQTQVPEMGGAFQTQSRFVSENGTCPNSSDGDVIRFDFEVQSVGTSAGNAISSHTQGWFYCNP